MALPTTPSARDEVFGLFRVKWETDTPALNGGVPIPVQWPGVDTEAPPAANEPYAAIFLRLSESGQTTFGNTGQRRFTRHGFVTVQCFAPLSMGNNASTLAESSAIIARDAFEGIGTDSGIWFYRARVEDVGATETWYQFNMVVSFQFDEMR